MNTKLELRNIFLEAVKSLSEEYKGSSLTDLFVIVDKESAQLSIFDDENNCIAQGIIQSWIDAEGDQDEEIPYAQHLRKVVQEMDKEGLFNSLEVFTPFSINLADEDFIVQEELLVIEDDSIIRLESDFMSRMDKEFDAFLDKLLKD